MANNSNQAVNMFEKVSFSQFEKDFRNSVNPEVVNRIDIKEIYDNIKLPVRKTKKSAGYDFFAPVGLSLLPGESIMIPTGIRVKCKDNEFLMVLPRSGQGSKYFNIVANTAGIIDADYYDSKNEGHIFIKLRRPDIINIHKTENTKNSGTKKYNYFIKGGQLDSAMNVDAGESFAQAIFVRYDMVDGDNYNNGATRDGGHGSTDKAVTNTPTV